MSYETEDYDKPVSAKRFMEDIFDAVHADCLGGATNSDQEIDKTISKKIVQKEVRFWNGQRFLVTVEKLPDGMAYCTNTGKEITQEEYNANYT